MVQVVQLAVVLVAAGRPDEEEGAAQEFAFDRASSATSLKAVGLESGWSFHALSFINTFSWVTSEIKNSLDFASIIRVCRFSIFSEMRGKYEELLLREHSYPITFISSDPFVKVTVTLIIETRKK